MQFAQLGRTGLRVSRICVGCMTYGVPDRGPHPWTLDESASRPILKRALELGINFFDTANIYSDGTSEEIVGRALRDFARRDEIVLATKLFYPMSKGPNTGGLSRKSVLRELDASLRRLGTDYVDLYQIHRWDPGTPIEETLEALHDVVRAGKVRYIGASSMFAWQFAKALHTSERRGLTRFATMQNHYNLLYREEEREMNPLCVDEGVALLPWSPLARGRLTRPSSETTPRQKADKVTKALYEPTTVADNKIIDRVNVLARECGVPPAQVALAWLLQKPGVCAPIVGASKEQHLLDAVAALDLNLTAVEVNKLEQLYVPHRVLGHE
ncbi:MAG: aldo/keto reductase [Polyangiaceae bacterium]